jgi:hypothetical protein
MILARRPTADGRIPRVLSCFQNDLILLGAVSCIVQSTSSVRCPHADFRLVAFVERFARHEIQGQAALLDAETGMGDA